MNKFRLRLIYSAHMLMPLSLMRWHLERLDVGPILELRSLFGGG